MIYFFSRQALVFKSGGLDSIGNHVSTASTQDKICRPWRPDLLSVIWMDCTENQHKYLWKKTTLNKRLFLVSSQMAWDESFRNPHSAVYTEWLEKQTNPGGNSFLSRLVWADVELQISTLYECGEQKSISQHRNTLNRAEDHMKICSCQPRTGIRGLEWAKDQPKQTVEDCWKTRRLKKNLDFW